MRRMRHEIYAIMIARRPGVFVLHDQLIGMKSNPRQDIHVIGGGLAGSEAAWQIASRGVPVTLHEMRPSQATPVHKTGALAELVCSNSFRSDDHELNAVGLLHEEMRR